MQAVRKGVSKLRGDSGPVGKEQADTTQIEESQVEVKHKARMGSTEYGTHADLSGNTGADRTK